MDPQLYLYILIIIFLVTHFVFNMAIKNTMDSSRIEMLNGNNFRAWKCHISYLLTHEKTLHTLSTSKPDDDSSWFQNKWIEDDAMAKATMLHNMKDNIISLFEE